MTTLAPQIPATIALMADIVGAYVMKNSVPASDLPGLIVATHATLAKLGAPPAPEPVKLEPPVPIRRTVQTDHIVSLEDGKAYKTLKRHLAGRGLTPDAYRQKWGLPPDYPMVAPAYAAQRSELAKASGLGLKRKVQVAAAKAAGKRASGR